mmetsp:Transcript_23447/g.77860  ORF Transcript_23447/g.77860 Transcript_23447/m.77860 type:complete len:209 (+) Transcript_23447:515-1141(+)
MREQARPRGVCTRERGALLARERAQGGGARDCGDAAPQRIAPLWRGLLFGPPRARRPLRLLRGRLWSAAAGSRRSTGLLLDPRSGHGRHVPDGRRRSRLRVDAHRGVRLAFPWRGGRASGLLARRAGARHRHRSGDVLPALLARGGGACGGRAQPGPSTCATQTQRARAAGQSRRSPRPRSGGAVGVGARGAAAMCREELPRRNAAAV